MTTYKISDGHTSETIQADDLASALESAVSWAAEGDYPEIESTIWVDVRATDTSDPDETDTDTARIDPPEPRCTADEHDWQSPHEIVGGIADNPGVHGNGGGVTIDECCMHCGAHRHIDTWAHRPDTGEQGLESVSYDGPGHYDISGDDDTLTERELEDEVVEANRDG